MNKLKRPGLPNSPSSPSSTSSGMSRTLALASGYSYSQVAPFARTTAAFATDSTPSFDIQPRSDVEQYWAARALKAESFISARMAHNDEIQTLRTSEEKKRAHELSTLRQENEARNSKLERLVLILLACLFTLSTLFIYLLSHSIRQPHNHKKSALSHFTIPILSPFTSVVEHETSVIGTKSIVFLFLILAILGYVAFRKWIGQRT